MCSVLITAKKKFYIIKHSFSLRQNQSIINDRDVYQYIFLLIDFFSIVETYSSVKDYLYYSNFGVNNQGISPLRVSSVCI
jgi:hypothetical protein